jgi:predicted kinase
MLVGLPGTGKSRLARHLAAELSAQLVETDRIRKQLFTEPRYTGGEHAAVYGWCYTLIHSALRTGHDVVFDATNLEERRRRRAYDIVADSGAGLEIIWTTCPARVVQERLLRRRERLDDDDASDADWSVYLEMQHRADPIRRTHTLINTATDFSSVARRLIERVLSGRVAD